MTLQTRQITLAGGVAAVLVALAATEARADGYIAYSDSGYKEHRTETVWYDPRIDSGIGVGINVGGGVFGFTDSNMRATTAPIGGMWAARVAFGTHVPLAFELGYMGSAQVINAELGRAQANLFGTTMEATLRYNVMPQYPWSPYVFAGAGWQRYDIDQRAFQLSDTGIANHDDLLVLPVGGGFAYRMGAFVTDVRGTFRAAQGAQLVLETPQSSLSNGSGSYAPMHTWDASINLGYEF